LKLFNPAIFSPAIFNTGEEEAGITGAVESAQAQTNDAVARQTIRASVESAQAQTSDALAVTVAADIAGTVESTQVQTAQSSAIVVNPATDTVNVFLANPKPRKQVITARCESGQVQTTDALATVSYLRIRNRRKAAIAASALLLAA
jgi:hypothetical protein